MGNCEVFDRKRCFGCVGLDPQYNTNEIKEQCETYQEEIKYERAKQMKLDEIDNGYYKFSKLEETKDGI
jgi:hypothetical protein